jgi:hypothetical protein
MLVIRLIFYGKRFPQNSKLPDFSWSKLFLFCVILRFNKKDV